jgi:hypothetical protein
MLKKTTFDSRPQIARVGPMKLPAIALLVVGVVLWD